MPASPLPETLGAWLLIAAAVFLGGAVRGATGFGGALVMVPLLAQAAAPATAVSLVLLIECVGYADMLRHAGRRIQWRAILPLTVAAILAVPLGVYLVTHLAVPVMMRIIAACVIGSALVLLTGWHYAGAPGWPATVGVGAAAGLLDGLAGVPGPPVALFLYGGPQPARTVRDNLVGFFLLLDLATLAAFAMEGTLRGELLWLGALSLPVSMLGNALGVRLARWLPEALLRRLALGLILLAGLALLPR
jgi:hypothetical protein